MKINLESTVPVYLQVANQIKEDIKEQKLQTGDMIPSDRAYCESLGVSHMTVKKAVDLLVSEGLVKGSGHLLLNRRLCNRCLPLVDSRAITMEKGTRLIARF